MLHREPDRHRELRQGERPLPWRVFGQFHKAMHAHRLLMARLMSEHDMLPAQAICMRELAHHDGITQRDLAELLGVSRPTVTVMLQKMERAGLIERHVDEADQRFTRIHLTDAGWQGHEEMHRLLDEYISRTYDRISESDQRELERVLGVLNEHLVEALGDQTPKGVAPAPADEGLL